MMEIIALFLMLVLGAAAMHKLIAQDRLASATAALLGAVQPVGHMLTLAAAGIEAMAALALIFETTRILGALIAGCLWVVYGGALLAARHRGAPIDCGCDFGSKVKPVDDFVLWRAAGFVVLALLVAVIPSSQLEIETLFAALALFSLYLAASELAVLPSLRRSVAS